MAKKTYSFFYLYHRTPPRNNWKPLQYSKNWKAKYSTKRSSSPTLLQNGTFCVCNDRFYQLFKTSSRQAFSINHKQVYPLPSCILSTQRWRLDLYRHFIDPIKLLLTIFLNYLSSLNKVNWLDIKSCKH